MTCLLAKALLRFTALALFALRFRAILLLRERYGAARDFGLLRTLRRLLFLLERDRDFHLVRQKDPNMFIYNTYFFL